MDYGKFIVITCALLINVSAIGDKEYEFSAVRIVKPMKNATVEVAVVDGLSSTITIVRNDGAQMRVELSMNAENVTSSTPSTITDANYPWVEIKHGNITYTSIRISSNSERIDVMRKMPMANVPMPAEHVTGSFNDCFPLKENIQWMGGPQLKYQRWPIQNSYFEHQAYTTNSSNNMAIAERYWLSSEGFSIWMIDYVQLFIDQNNEKKNYLCFNTENKFPYKDSSVHAFYQIGFSSDARAAQEFTGKHYWIPPSQLPDTSMIMHPIWSTFQRYGRNISEAIVNNFTDEINLYNFTKSQLQIDDNWESCYGSGQMDPVRFPNVTRLTNSLKNKGFRVTLWAHPFININCDPNYSDALNRSFFVQNFDDDTRASWWNGPNGAGVIDFTYYNATISFVERLKSLESLGIDGFSFDAAEASWIPQIPNFRTGLPSYRPSYFTTTYATAVSRYFGNMSIVNAQWNTQNLPIFTRMANKDSKIAWNNGLPTLITTLLQMNLAGYYFVVPDVVGGSGDIINGKIPVRPSKNLYIRWMQATVFMPVMHFSISPWEYDEETITICKKYVNLHNEMAPTILKLMNDSITKRIPLNAPIWWVDPKNPRAYEINDEYLLGEDILVAPIIEENALVRDIYFPAGTWHDPVSFRNFVGPSTFVNYPSHLDILPYFIRRK